MATCKCGRKIIPIGYETVEIDENGEEITEAFNSGYGYNPYDSSEKDTRKTMMYACEDPFCIYRRKMTYTQLCEYENEQAENDEIEDMMSGAHKHE